MQLFMFNSNISTRSCLLNESYMDGTHRCFAKALCFGLAGCGLAASLGLIGNKLSKTWFSAFIRATAQRVQIPKQSTRRVANAKTRIVLGTPNPNSRVHGP